MHWQLALEESRKEAERLSTQPNNTVSGSTLSQSALDDLLSLGLGQMVSYEQNYWDTVLGTVGITRTITTKFASGRNRK